MCDLAQEGEDESNLGDGACRGDESACCDSRKDIWGIGLSMKDENRFDLDKWKGQNLLGYALMMVREQFSYGGR